MKKKLLYNEVIIKQKNKYNIEKINNIFDKSIIFIIKILYWQTTLELKLNIE